jgi:hypothetical protein
LAVLDHAISIILGSGEAHVNLKRIIVGMTDASKKQFKKWTVNLM